MNMAGWRVAAAIAVLLAAASAIAAPCGAPTRRDGYQQLDQGYRALYNLDFDGAESAFVRWEMNESRNPLGPASRASGYLFREFERLGVLRTELFADDKSFESRSKLLPDPQLKLRFQQQISLADRLAGEILAEDPSSTAALLAKTLVNGLQADYAALIEKRNAESLSYTEKAGDGGNACFAPMQAATTPILLSVRRTTLSLSSRYWSVGLRAWPAQGPTENKVFSSLGLLRRTGDFSSPLRNSCWP